MPRHLGSLVVFTSVPFVSSQGTCDAIKARFHAESCCGSSAEQAVCVPDSVDVSGWSTSALGLVDCFTRTSVVGGVSPGCETHFPSSGLPRVALSGGRVAKENSPYSAFSSKKWRIVQQAQLQDGSFTGPNKLMNFWHSMSMTPDHIYLGVRHTPGYIPSESVPGMPQSVSGVYQFNRSTLERTAIFPGLALKAGDTKTYGVMRYAPVVADGHVFSTHWGFSDPFSRVLYKTPESSFPNGATYRDIAADFGNMRAGQGIAGPMASQPSDDATCGTRLFVSSMSYGYFSPFNDLDQTRPLGLDNLVSHRGRIQCYCSKTMEPCWDEYYFNGKAGGMPADFATVEAKHVNTARTDFLGTVRQVSCSDLPTIGLTVDRAIPKYFTVTLNTTLTTGAILTGDNNVMLLVEGVSGTDADVSYYAGHYNTPSVGMILNNTGQLVELVSLQSVTLDHGFAVAGQPLPDNPGKANLTADVTDTVHAVSAFTDPLDLSGLSGTCASTEAFNAVVALEADTFYPGQPATTVDYSGITVKTKHAVGEALPADGRKAVHSSGANNWTPCALDDASDTLLCPFGNAHMLSFDRYQVMKPVLALQRELEADRVAAIAAQDKDAFVAALGRQQEILALNAQQMALLSEYDASFKEDAIHAIDSKTGALKWATQLEGTDQWFLALMSSSGFDQFWDVAAAAAFGTDIWKDVDANNVAVQGNVVYAGTKGGTVATMDLTTGAVTGIHRVAPGSPSGGAAPGNYGGFCVTEDGIVVTLNTVDTSPSATATYTWMTNTGTLVPNKRGYLVAWDARSQTELWSAVVDVENIVGGISCIEDHVIAVCPSASGVCNYNARTGEISQTIERLSVDPFSGAEGTGKTLDTASVTTMCDGADCYLWSDGNKLTKMRLV